MRRYRVDFALTANLGNLGRYLTLRPLVEADDTVTTRWFPVRIWLKDDWLGIFPGVVRVRLRPLLDSWRLYVLPPAEAIVIHTPEVYHWYVCLQMVLRRETVIINNSDGGLDTHHNKIAEFLLRQAVHRTDVFLPWSEFAAQHMITVWPDLPRDRLFVLHPGIDLTRWPLRSHSQSGPRFQILFVGGDLERKGAPTLLEAFQQGLCETCDLDIATQSGFLSDDFKQRLLTTPNVRLHVDLAPGSAELQALYRKADAFVLPTNYDPSSFAALEALATGIPVVICPHGGIPEIVVHEQTGLHVPPKDPAAIIAAVERLRADPELGERLVRQGRAHVEEHFDTRTNASKLLRIAKTLVDGGSIDEIEQIVPRSRLAERGQLAESQAGDPVIHR